jgi:hypothetical protein
LSESFVQLPPDGTGKKLRAIYRNNLDTYEEVQACNDVETINPIYAVAVSGSTVAANKNHLTLWNGSTYRLRVLKILASMHTTGAVTGFAIQYLVHRVSSMSGGTILAIEKLDIDDPNPPFAIVATTSATVATIGSPLVIFTLNPEDTGGSSYIDFVPPKPIILKQNSGLTIRQYSTTGVGFFNAVVYFSTEVIKP